MVLKVIQLTVMEAAKILAALSVIATFMWGVGGFLALMLWNTYRDDVIKEAGLASREDVARIETALVDASTNFATLSRQIILLSRPDHITVYREAPHVVGDCVAGEVCTISVFAERDPRATECQIRGPETQLLIVADSREYVATPVQQRRATNLGSTPRALEPQFQLPQALPKGPATAVIRSYYDKCLWQVDGQPPAITDSPPFVIDVQ